MPPKSGRGRVKKRRTHQKRKADAANVSPEKSKKTAAEPYSENPRSGESRAPSPPSCRSEESRAPTPSKQHESLYQCRSFS